MKNNHHPQLTQPVFNFSTTPPRQEDQPTMFKTGTEKMFPDEWSLLTGIRVLDADGWDRRNYEVSWHTPITRSDFLQRAARSTCVGWPSPLLDERSPAPDTTTAPSSSSRCAVQRCLTPNQDIEACFWSFNGHTVHLPDTEGLAYISLCQFHQAYFPHWRPPATV